MSLYQRLSIKHTHKVARATSKGMLVEVRGRHRVSQQTQFTEQFVKKRGNPPHAHTPTTLTLPTYQPHAHYIHNIIHVMRHNGRSHGKKVGRERGDTQRAILLSSHHPRDRNTESNTPHTALESTHPTKHTEKNALIEPPPNIMHVCVCELHGSACVRGGINGKIS